MPPPTPVSASLPAPDWPRLVLVFSQRGDVVTPWQHNLDAALGAERYKIYRVTTLSALERSIQEYTWAACVLDVTLADACGLGAEQLKWVATFAPPLAYCPQNVVSDEEQEPLARLGYAGWLGQHGTGVQLHEVIEQLADEPGEGNDWPVPALPPPPPALVSPGRSAGRAAEQRMPPATGTLAAVPIAPTPREARGITAAHLGGRSLVPDSSQSPARGVPAPGAPPVVHDWVFACWSPFDTLDLDVTALNLGVAFRRQGLRTLVGECRRPAGPLVSLLRMEAAHQERSLLRAARASQTDALYREDYGAFLSTHLLLGQAVPQSAEDLYLFISSPPDNGVALLEEPELNPERSRFVPTLLEKTKRFWQVSLLLVGSNVADPLHLGVMRAAHRLLVVLPVETDALERAELLLPALLEVTDHTPDQVDVLLVQADRSLPAPEWEELTRLLARPDQDGRKVAQAVARWQQTQARRQQEEVARRQQEVHALLKRCGLPLLAGVLPDSLPWMRMLRQKSRKDLMPLLCHPELARTPYAQAIEALAAAWVQAAQVASQ